MLYAVTRERDASDRGQYTVTSALHSYDALQFTVIYALIYMFQ